VRSAILFIPIICTLFVTATSLSLSGQIIGIKDGDTIVLLTDDNRQIVIRLSGIDCPEKNQPFGTKAKQFTSNLVYGKRVCVQTQSRDRYGRTIGTVYLPDGRILNNELVSSGYAWHYEHYSKDTTLQRLQQEAKKAQRGLWSDSNAVAPWDFRHHDKSSASGPPVVNYKTVTDVSTYIIYNTETGKYHAPTCRWAAQCSDNCISISLKVALRRGGIPCKVCYGTHKK